MIVLSAKERVNVTGVWVPTWVTLAGRLPQLHSFGHICDKKRLLAVLAGAVGGAVAIAGNRGILSHGCFPAGSHSFRDIDRHRAGFAQGRTGTATRPDRWSPHLHVSWGAHRQILRSGTVGRGAYRRAGAGRNASDRDVSPAAGRSIHWWWWLSTTCPGTFLSRRLESVRCCSRCSPLPGTIWSSEAPTGVIPGQQRGGELCDRPIPKSLSVAGCASQPASRKIFAAEGGGLGRNGI